MLDKLSCSCVLKTEIRNKNGINLNKLKAKRILPHKCQRFKKNALHCEMNRNEDLGFLLIRPTQFRSEEMIVIRLVDFSVFDVEF